MEALERPPRKTYIDAIRILACVGVIYNHVVAHRLLESGAPAGYWPLFAYSLCKTAVPLFLMLSGTLLLSRTDTYQKTLLRCLRIAFALAFAISINYAYYCVQNGAPFDIGQLVLCIYRDRLGLTYSYWYLYRYLSLLVMLPVLQRLAGRMTQKDIAYFLLLAVGVCGLTIAGQFFLPWLRPNEFLVIPLFSIYIGMLFMGYFIDRYVPKKRGLMLAAGIGLLACNAIAAFLLYRAQAIDPERAWYLDRCDRTSIVLTAGCLFYLVKCADAGWTLPDRLRGWISRIGRLTFGVYLVSELLIDALGFLRTWLEGFVSVWCAERLYVAIVFVAGVAVAALLKRIPLVKKLL